MQEGGVPFAVLRARSRPYIAAWLAAGDGADDEEGLFAGGDFGGKRRVPGFVREVFSAGEEAEERAALLRIMVADGPAQHGIAGFEFIQDRTQGGWNGKFESNLAVHVSQCAEMRGEYDANHGSGGRMS